MNFISSSFKLDLHVRPFCVHAIFAANFVSPPGIGTIFCSKVVPLIPFVFAQFPVRLSLSVAREKSTNTEMTVDRTPSIRSYPYRSVHAPSNNGMLTGSLQINYTQVLIMLPCCDGNLIYCIRFN